MKLHGPRSGFTLLEIVVVVAIIAMLAGAAVPLASKMLQSQARKATKSEVEALGDAALEYFRDTGAVPGSVAALLANPGVTGWAGPYLAGTVRDTISGLAGYEVDAWSRAYVVTAGTTWTVASRGPDGITGNADDVSLLVDFTPVKRELTLDRLRTINNAITLYNQAYGATSPLSTSYTTLLDRLVTTAYLPTRTGYTADAWGSAFTPDPSGATPVVRVTSPNIGTTGAGSGGAGAGAGGSNSGNGGNGGNNGNNGNGRGGGNNGNGRGNGGGNGSNGRGGRD
ncbi:MAG: prepilin-type N-terminal cleavage/methylation domain-containing protein [Planctomycetes bacterium]|nr:prepilin-type N-terminal cleavage/methylation domain-containing protein [Planctomycetota bacterium]